MWTLTWAMLSGDDGPRLGAMAVFKLMLKNPVIMTIAAIEFCSGFLRQAIMQWYRTFAKQTDGELQEKSSFVFENWGMLLCCAGIMGGVFARRDQRPGVSIPPRARGRHLVRRNAHRVGGPLLHL